MNEYEKFLESKRHSIGNFGFDANFMSSIRRLLGYKAFNSLIRKSVLGHF